MKPGATRQHEYRERHSLLWTDGTKVRHDWDESQMIETWTEFRARKRRERHGLDNERAIDPDADPPPTRTLDR